MIERFEAELRHWEEEYRLYGPDGTVEPNKTGLTEAKIQGLSDRLMVLRRMDANYKREIEAVRQFIQSSV